MIEVHMPRPRKNGERYPSGELRPRKDLGTPEVIAKRLALVGPGNSDRPPDPALAHYPLGVAFARGIVTSEQHQAGLDYALAFAVAIGRPAMGAGRALARFMADDRGAMDDADRERLTTDWRAYGDALLAHSRAVKDTLENVVVYERLPAWLLPGHVEAPSDVTHRERLIDGLRIIERIKRP